MIPGNINEHNIENIFVSALETKNEWLIFKLAIMACYISTASHTLNALLGLKVSKV